jgi:hypothetical protein
LRRDESPAAGASPSLESEIELFRGSGGALPNSDGFLSAAETLCAGLAMVGGIASADSFAGNSVGGGSVCLGSGISSVAFASKGTSRIDPSTRQKVKLSSKVRLHVGQLFIAHLASGKSL